MNRHSRSEMCDTDNRITLIVNAADKVKCVVWEESFVVEGVGQQLSHGGTAHGLVVVVLAVVPAERREVSGVFGNQLENQMKR
eukprot:scaffold16605_cov50-Prasinocladus_malaysianus.AAC.3